MDKNIIVLIIFMFIFIIGFFFVVVIRSTSKKVAAESSSNNSIERSTIEQAGDWVDTRGTTGQTKEDIAQQLETGVSKEDKPSNPSNIDNVLKSLTDILTDPLVYAAVGIQLAPGILSKIDDMTKQLTRPVINSIAEGAESAIARTGAKLAGKVAERTSIKVAQKTAVKAGQRIATQATIAATTGPAAPFVLAAEIAFNIISSAMDGLNLGGFQNLKNSSMLNEMKNTIDEYFDEQVGKNKLPLVYGPLDRLSKDELTEKIVKKVGEIIKNDSNRKTDQTYINSVVDKAFSGLCTDLGGFNYKHPVTGNNVCSLTQTQCVPPWPQQAGDTYYEFKNGVCQVRPSIMRNTCEKMGLGVTYNQNTGSCNFTEEYCGRYSGSAKVVNNDCEVTNGQKIAEMIFGTTITRSIINIFDFKNNYESCPSGMNEPTELVALAALTGPGIIAAGGAMAFASQYLCSGSKCNEGEEMMMQTLGVDKKLGGLCYPSCRAGYESHWGDERSSAIAGMCYETCPAGMEPSAGFCTRFPDTITDVGVSAKCPSNYITTVEGPGGMCQPRCPDDFPVEQGGLCYKSSVERLAGGAIATTIPAKKRGCDPGQRDDGTSCWEDAKCRTWADSNWNWEDGGFIHTRCTGCGCIKKTVFNRYYCPDGYRESTSGLCQAIERTPGLARSLLSVGACPDSGKTYPQGHSKAGQKVILEKEGGVCYLPCDWYGGSYKRTAVGTCQMDALSTLRKSYSRAPIGPAYSVIPKKRKTPFPSTSEDDFKNSTIGKYVQAGINAARDGDPEKFGKALAGFALTANPTVLSLGAQELTDLGAREIMQA